MTATGTDSEAHRDDAVPMADDPRRDLAEQPWAGSGKEQIAAALFNRPAPRTTVGRYEIQRKLGHGAMGVVLVGFDAQLDRTVALKLVRRDVLDDEGVATRVMREAQALGRLAHPNVVVVHEVGEHAGQLFIAMELVPGDTLHAWKRAAPRGWRQCLQVYLQAGRGLAAAHDAGLVHRDFKPANCILGEDERVRVLDFGLARGTASELEGTLDEAAHTSQRVLDASVTSTGALIGTPAYMAPEQLQGGSVDALSDQFAFCVALYEALLDVRPFHGASGYSLYTSIQEGTIQRPRAGERKSVPRGLLQIVRRGLRFEPHERWPTMGALLEALERFPVRRKLAHRLVGLGGVLALGAVAVVGLTRSEPCLEIEDLVVPGWSASEREELQAAVSAAGPQAEATWTGLRSTVDRWGQRWRSVHGEACRAARVDHRTTEIAYGRQMACLERAGRTTQALLDGLRGDSQAWLHARETALALPIVAPCSRAEALLSIAPPAAPVADEVQAIRDEVDTAVAARVRGDSAGALRHLEGAWERAQLTEYTPLLGEIGVHRGRMLLYTTQDSAREVLVTALHDAELAGDDLVAADAATLLVEAAMLSAQPQQAGQWRTLADAKLRRAHAGPIRHAQLALQSAMLALRTRDLEAATAAHERAMQLLGSVVATEHPLYVDGLSSRARLVEQTGSRTEAHEAHDTAVNAIRETVGESPKLAAALYNRALFVFTTGGAVEAAEADLQEALAILERAPFDDIFLARARMALAEMRSMRGELQLAAVDAAIAPLQTLPVNAPERLEGLSWHAAFVQRLGEPQTAMAEYREVIQVLRGQPEVDTEQIAMLTSNVGECLLALERADEARAEFAAALEPLEKTLPPGHDRLSYPLAGLGASYLALGQLQRAREPLERALAISETFPGDVLKLAGVQWSLAQTLTGLGTDADRAHTLASQAAAQFAGLGEEGEVPRRQIEAWQRRGKEK